MARLRSAAASLPSPAPTPVPEKLATWYVDDWIRDNEIPTSHGLHTQTPGERGQSRWLVSRSRFLAARARWLAEQQAAGRPVPHLRPPGRGARRTPKESP